MVAGTEAFCKSSGWAVNGAPCEKCKGRDHHEAIEGEDVGEFNCKHSFKTQYRRTHVHVETSAPLRHALKEYHAPRGSHTCHGGLARCKRSDRCSTKLQTNGVRSGGSAHLPPQHGDYTDSPGRWEGPCSSLLSTCGTNDVYVSTWKARCGGF